MGLSGRSIELFFHSGDPDGMISATIPFQWTGHVLVANRIGIEKNALKEPETAQPGIYMLVGEKDGRQRLYVGETDEIRGRINQHIKHESKDWWEKAIFVTAKGEPLNKAHARYLESRIFQIASQVRKVELDNRQAPSANPLSRAAQVHMEGFLQNLMLILPALRFDFLHEEGRPAPAPLQPSLSAMVDIPIFFVLSTKEVEARARMEGEDFIVEKGSEARSSWVGLKTTGSSYAKLYNELVDRGIIETVGDKRRFAQDYAFNSVSAAASVVTGRPTSGTGAWRLASDSTKSYGDYEKERTQAEIIVAD